MLRLTGAQADGWLPSMSYLDVAGLPEMHDRVDDAAVKAGPRPGRRPPPINLTGDFLDDAPVERLAELNLTTA